MFPLGESKKTLELLLKILKHYLVLFEGSEADHLLFIKYALHFCCGFGENPDVMCPAMQLCNLF